MTYTPIASQTLGVNSTSVTFSSIPSGFRDLILHIGCNASTAGFPRMRLNGDSGTNYNNTGLVSNGADNNKGVTGNSNVNYLYFTQTSIYSTPMSFQLYFYDYSQTNKHKQVRALSGVAIPGDTSTTRKSYDFARWASTAAINSLTIDGLTFAAGSTFSLYGVSA